MDSPELLDARRSLAAVSAKFAADPEYRERLKDPAFAPEDFANIGLLLRFLEHISVLVSKGGIAEGLVMAEYADTFVLIWEQLRPVIVQRRHAFGKHTGRAFEHLAMRAKRYIDSVRWIASTPRWNATFASCRQSNRCRAATVAGG